MNRNNNFNKYKKLRKEYPYFIYENYSILKNKNFLDIEFTFNLADKFHFTPKIKIPKREFYNKKLSVKDLKNIVFQIGMIELISYWKSACSPKIIIKPHILNNEQIKWWEKLYFNGMGEFFYLNSIDADIDSFVKIIIDSKDELKTVKFRTDNSTIIPIGGGKDSAVTLELLSKLNNDTPLILNTRKASIDTIKTAGYSRDKIIEIQRSIDPKLLELNEKGFLNGHTPFSALLAFISILAAIITGKKNIAFSNESSANEATIKKTNINHQYSKSFTFEKDFRFYINKYISNDFNYFSFLRPLNELQIAKLFSGFEKYFYVFKSCNVGSKTNSWCGKCPKCLFTYIILSPFIQQSKLVKIFSKNLFDEKDLLKIFNQLIGIEKVKPFECVGTVEEINIALCMIIKNIDTNNLPYLLKYYVNTANYKRYKNEDYKRLLNNFNTEHFLSREFEDILRSPKVLRILQSYKKL